MNNYALRQAWIGFPLLSECCHFSDVRLKPNRRVLPPLEIHITISNIRDFNIISILPAILNIISPGFSLFSSALGCTQSLLPGHFCTSTNLVTWAEPVAESYNPPGTVYYFSLYGNADHEQHDTKNHEFSWTCIVGLGNMKNNVYFYCFCHKGSSFLLLLIMGIECDLMCVIWWAGLLFIPHCHGSL